jgi:hypothetical protein
MRDIPRFRGGDQLYLFELALLGGPSGDVAA